MKKRIRLHDRITSSQLWRSIFRHTYPTSDYEATRTARMNFFLHLHPPWVSEQISRIRHTWCMGGISFLLFIFLTITGGLLMFYYHPTIDHAYHDMKDLEFVIPFGQVLRNFHRWAAHGMVITAIAHMARVFYTGSYRPPREFNWLIGVCLLLLTLFLSFTGYLLPWDQLAYWAVTVGTSMARAMPIIGADGPFSIADTSSDIGSLLLGGRTVGPSALLRFYVLHVFALPLIGLFLMLIHFWRVRKDKTVQRPL